MRVSQSFYEIIKKPSSVLQGLNILFLITVLFLSNSIQGQSLVRNGDFESHTAFSDGFSPIYWGIDHLRHWSTSGWNMISYCQLDLETRTDTLFKRSSCCGNTIIPHTGKGMVKMSYDEACPFAPSTGCASYIHARLIESLEVGSVYEATMWVYFPKDMNEDSAILHNIGFYLSLSPEDVGVHDLLKTDFFFAGSIPRDEWFEIKHYIRALCPLQNITIGAFKDANFPSIVSRQIDNWLVYFVDDVQIIKVNEEDVPSNIQPSPFCNYFERKKKEEEIAKVDQVSIYFQTNESTLDKSDLKRLDSFYLSKEGNQGRAFVLSGYTDMEGNDHERLSADRVRSVRQYLDSTYHLTDEMIICFAKGVDTLGDNRTEAGKKLNRRVTIQNSNITSLQALYRKGLEYMSLNQIPEAARTFKAWIQAAPIDMKMSMLHDPRLDPLRKLPVWKFLTTEVRNMYHIYGQPRNAFFLDSMYFVDQRYRTYSPYYLTWYLPGLDTFTMKELDRDWDFILPLDSANFITIEKYLDKNGYPKISQVGRRQAKTVPYILIHNADSVLLETYLPIMKEYCLEGEAEWDIYATMFDKLKLIQDLPQHYGTQYTYIDPEQTKLTYYKLDSIDAVNARRRSIGMAVIDDPGKVINVRRE